MIKRIICLFLTTTVLLLLCSCSSIKEVFWDLVGAEFDREERIRAEKIANGEIVRGKDTVLIWGDTFEIGHLPDSDNLYIYISGSPHTVLRGVSTYKKTGECLYIIADEGYAIIDNNDFCRIYINSDSQTDAIDSSRVESEHLKYLSSFDEFTPSEREVFMRNTG